MLRSIQYLRGVAASMITLHHALAGIYGGVPIPLLHGGVDIFFVISGMIMWRVTDGRPVSPASFMWRRVVRVVPLYWAVTSLMVAVLLIAPHLLRTARFDLAHIVASYLFVPWQSPAPDGGSYPLLVPGWTLNYEMFFYALFALALAGPVRARGMVILGALLSLAVTGLVVPDLPLIAQVYTAPIILEFGLGVAIAMTVGRFRMPRTGLVLLGVGCIALAVLAAGEPSGMDRLLRLGIPAALIVAGAMLWEGGKPVPLAPSALLVGNASYAIYLVHTPWLAALAVAWSLAGLSGRYPLILAALGVVSATILGIVVHWLVERPLIAALSGRRVPAVASA